MGSKILRTGGYVLALAGLLAGCDFFDDEDRLEGERIRIRDARAANDIQTVPGEPIPAAIRLENWTQTNGQANHASGHLQGPTSLSLAWRADAGSGDDSDGTITSAPIVLGGRIFTMDSRAQLTAFDAQTGSEIWRTELTPEGEDDEDGFGGGLAAEGSTIFATTGFGEVVAVSAASGDIIWRYRSAAAYRAAPAVARSTIFAVNRDNEAIALSASSGAPVWRQAGITSEAGLLGGASPAVQSGLVVLPFGSGEIMGVDFSSGRQVWSAVLGGARRGLARSSIADVTGDPVIAGRAVVAANQSGRIVAIDGQTGRRGWTRSIGSTGPIWAAGDSVYVVSDTSELVRLALRSGGTVWRTELPQYEDPDDREDPIAYSGPVLVGGQILVTDSLGNLMTFSPDTGTQNATIDLSDGSTTGPVVAGGLVYVLSSDGELQAFR
ncbi:MAG: PQQ-binding-like beta-propeller repeat protein [Pseudomonadota bacterium]